MGGIVGTKSFHAAGAAIAAVIKVMEIPHAAVIRDVETPHAAVIRDVETPHAAVIGVMGIQRYASPNLCRASSWGCYWYSQTSLRSPMVKVPRIRVHQWWWLGGRMWWTGG